VELTVDDSSLPLVFHGLWITVEIGTHYGALFEELQSSFQFFAFFLVLGFTTCLSILSKLLAPNEANMMWRVTTQLLEDYPVLDRR
jgi:hypothetical protein